MKEPEKVDLQKEDVDNLVDRIKSSNLPDSDQTLIIKVLQFNLWLQHMLRETKLSIRRLSRLFGITTENRNRRAS